MAIESLRCPNCQGDIELDKDQEFGFCKYCGTKVQNVKMDRMKISGKVKIDDSEFIEKQLRNARRAKEKEDWEEVEKYYNLVEQNDPSNIEAIFYSSYGKAKSSLVDGDLYKRQAAFKVLTNCISIVDDNFQCEKDNNKEIISQISEDILNMMQSNYVYHSSKNGYGIEIYNDKNQTISLFERLSAAFMETIEHIVESYSDERIEDKVFYLKLAVVHSEYLYKHLLPTNLTFATLREAYRDKTVMYHEWLHQIDPTYEIPEVPTVSQYVASSGGCYVATCVYGSYDCPQVWTLRRYRDDSLAKTWYGRVFISLYYAVSPTLVKLFGETIWFKSLWKHKLDKMVNRLNNEGYDNTPYDDIDWKRKH